MDKRNNYSNIPSSIEAKIGKNIHNMKNHPVEIMKLKLFEYFKSLEEYKFEYFDNLSPFVSITDNFDKLLIPATHPSRSKSDTYYVNEQTVLRTHTSAHQNELLAKGYTNFLVVGDVYRKDEIDCSHYPVFHQMEGVIKITNGKNPKDELIKILNGLVEYLFPGCKYRTNDDYFPFTDPSFEYEVEYRNNWLEILGCGVVHKDILANNGLDKDEFVAFGLGLERLVMVQFDIPDIRYLWSEHPRFIEQFSSGQIVKFKPYSELPTMYIDISFWIPSEMIDNDKWLEENDFFEIARETMGDWVESIKLKDTFVHPIKKQTSRMYRTIFSPSDPSLNDPSEFTKKCNELQLLFRDGLKRLNIVIR